MSTGMLGLYWRQRQESLHQCAASAFETLSIMMRNGYDTFYLRGRSRRNALQKPFEVSEQSVLELLAKGVNRRDVGREPIPELGWMLALWSGHPDGQSYSISIRCGCYSSVAGNAIVLNLPELGPHSLVHSSERAVSAFHELVNVWKPVQGVLCEGNIRWEGGVLVPEGTPIELFRETAKS